MKTFLFLLTYKKQLDVIDQYLPAHIEFLDKYYAKKNFLTSGRKNPRTGGVILCRFNSLEEAHAAIKEDPFFIHEIADVDIVEFEPSRGILV